MEIFWQSVLGHTDNKMRLRRFLQEKRLPHALLLTGPRGIGKSRIAEVLAAAVLCLEPREGEACGHCASCQALAGGVHPDFYSLLPEAKGKATPVIKIEAVRELQTELSRVPKLSKGRVVIIDEADHMNEAAANALLKTLEEPVGVVYFFLLTAARQALLPTVVSRCMPLTLKPLQDDDLTAVLLKLGCKAEAIGQVMAQAEGSPGVAMELMADGAELSEQAAGLLMVACQRDELALWQKAKSLGNLERTKAAAVLGKVRLLLRDLLALKNGAAALAGTSLGELEQVSAAMSRAGLLEALQLTADFEHRLLTSNVTVRLALEGYLLRLGALA